MMDEWTGKSSKASNVKDQATSIDEWFAPCANSVLLVLRGAATRQGSAGVGARVHEGGLVLAHNTHGHG